MTLCFNSLNLIQRLSRTPSCLYTVRHRGEVVVHGCLVSKAHFPCVLLVTCYLNFPSASPFNMSTQLPTRGPVYWKLKQKLKTIGGNQKDKNCPCRCQTLAKRLLTIWRCSLSQRYVWQNKSQEKKEDQEKKRRAVKPGQENNCYKCKDWTKEPETLSKSLETKQNNRYIKNKLASLAQQGCEVDTFQLKFNSDAPKFSHLESH